MENNQELEKIGQYTFRLFTEPSFIEGFTSILNFKKLMATYHTDQTPLLADTNSIKADWHAIGDDMQIAFNKYESERSSK